jgi:regulatory protein
MVSNAKLIEQAGKEPHWLAKARNFCTYQERCQQELRDKLYDWKAKPDEVEETISAMISEGFLDEERYAKAFAGGKFRIKKWGRRKIIYALKAKQISDYCIKKGLLEIDEDDYLETLKSVLISRDRNYNSVGPIKQKLLATYLIGRGFESELVWKTIKTKD